MHGSSTIELGHMRNQFLYSTRVSHTKHSLNLRQRYLIASIGTSLVKQAKRIAHTTRCRSGNQFGSRPFYVDMFLLSNKLQVLNNLARCNPLEIKALAAREHCRQHFMHICRSHDKDSITRWLL